MHHGTVRALKKVPHDKQNRDNTSTHSALHDVFHVTTMHALTARISQHTIDNINLQAKAFLNVLSNNYV